MAKTDTPKTDAVPAFGSVALDALPESAKRTANETTVALGRAILAAMDGGNAAVDPGSFADRAAAVKRAAVLRRAVAATLTNVKIGTRIFQRDGEDTYSIAVVPRTEPEPERGSDLAD